MLIIADLLPQLTSKLESFDLFFTAEIGEKGIQALIKTFSSLPSTLTSLMFNIQACDLGASRIYECIKGLPSGLLKIYLDLNGTRMTSKGAAFIGKSLSLLPASLTFLKLDLSRNQIGDEGLISSAQNLRKGLTSLNLTVSDCSIVRWSYRNCKLLG